MSILPLLPLTLRLFRLPRAHPPVVTHRPFRPLHAACLALDFREVSNLSMRLGFVDVAPEAVGCHWERARLGIAPCPLALLDSATLLDFFPMSPEVFENLCFVHGTFCAVAPLAIELRFAGYLGTF